MNHENYSVPLRTKTRGERVDTDLPIVMFDKPYQWLRDMVTEAVYYVGVLSIAIWVVVALGYFYARYVS